MEIRRYDNIELSGEIEGDNGRQKKITDKCAAYHIPHSSLSGIDLYLPPPKAAYLPLSSYISLSWELELFLSILCKNTKIF